MSRIAGSEIGTVTRENVRQNGMVPGHLFMTGFRPNEFFHADWGGGFEALAVLFSVDDDDPTSFDELGEVALPVIDTGENGIFSLEEFSAITTGEQMEFDTYARSKRMPSLAMRSMFGVL